jgi:hypothetical protein
MRHWGLACLAVFSFDLFLYHMMGHRRVLLSVLVLVLRLPFASLGLASGGSHIQQNVDGVSGLS